MSPTDVVLAWVEAFNRRDADAAADLYHPDAVNHQVAFGEPTVGREAIRAMFRSFFAAFPDSFTTVESLTAEGDRVALEWSGGGTWRGPLPGRPPTGKAFTLRGSGFFTVTDGRIRFQRGYVDRATWFGQIGLPV